MNALLTALKLVFPMFIYMLLGWGLQRRKFFSEDALNDLNELAFRVFLPLSVIQSILNSDLKSGINWGVIIFAFTATLIVFFISWFMMPHFSDDKTVISVMIQGVSKSNYVLLATSMVMMLYGDEIGMAGVLVALVAPLNNTLSAITFELYCGKKVSAGKLLRKIITNPIVASGFIGIALNLSGIKIPSYIMTQVLGKLSACATPLAMIMLGAAFDFSCVRKYKKQLGIVTTGRLLIVPLLEFPLLLICGFKGPDLMALLICAASPTAINSYSTAVSMGGNRDLAGAVVAITSALSVLTLFFWFTLTSAMELL